MSQKDKIRKHLLSGQSITAGEALLVYGCFRLAARIRELREETGYEGGQARVLGQISPNPAIMSNTCFTVLIENCRCAHPVEFDSGEDLVTQLVPADDAPRLVADGKIGHCLVVVALYYFDLWRRGLKQTVE